MKENVLSDKAYALALRMVKIYKFVCEEHKECVFSKQILRSGTSIEANIEESIHAQFIHKLSIAQKESSETNYWLRILRDSDFIKPKLAEPLLADCEEIQKLLTS